MAEIQGWLEHHGITEAEVRKLDALLWEAQRQRQLIIMATPIKTSDTNPERTLENALREIKQLPIKLEPFDEFRVANETYVAGNVCIDEATLEIMQEFYPPGHFAPVCRFVSDWNKPIKTRLNLDTYDQNRHGIKAGTYWKHYKGTIYVIDRVLPDDRTGEDRVQYHAQDKPEIIWSRTVSRWREPEGNAIRFAPLQPDPLWKNPLRESL